MRSAGFRYGQRTVDFTSGRYLADYSGKGELDATAIPEAERVPGYSYNWTPYGYFQDGAIGYKICDLPEANKPRSEEHTSELQSLMRISYAVFCLKKKKHI